MIDRAKELIKQGLSVREAAEMLDVTEKHLHVIMYRHKVKVSDLRMCAKKGPVVHINGKYQGKYTQDQVRAAIVEGLGYKGAAEILDTDHHRLKAWCRTNDIIVKEVLRKFIFDVFTAYQAAQHQIDSLKYGRFARFIIAHKNINSFV